MGKTERNPMADHANRKVGSVRSKESTDDAATEKAQAQSKSSSRRKRIKQSRIPADDFRLLIQSNAHFYSAFSSLDMKAMESVWLQDGRCICHFPGMKRLVGYKKIMKSFRIACHEMDGATRRNWMEPTEIQVEFQTSEKATIFCQELMYSIRCTVVDGELRPESELIKKLSATNAFKKVNGKWHLWYHQATALSDSETDFVLRKIPIDAPPTVDDEEELDQENSPPVMETRNDKKSTTTKTVTQTSKNGNKDKKPKNDKEMKSSAGTQKKDSKDKKTTDSQKKDLKDSGKAPMPPRPKKDDHIDDRTPMSPTASRKKKPIVQTVVSQSESVESTSDYSATSMTAEDESDDDDPPTSTGENEYSDMSPSQTFDTFQEILRDKNPSRMPFNCVGLS